MPGSWVHRWLTLALGSVTRSRMLSPLRSPRHGESSGVLRDRIGPESPSE